MVKMSLLEINTRKKEFFFTCKYPILCLFYYYQRDLGKKVSNLGILRVIYLKLKCKYNI